MTQKKKDEKGRLIAVRSNDLLGCPFCGAIPIMERWHGGGPLKRLISCINEDCDVSPSVTGQRPSEAIARWNHRAT